MKKRKLPLWAVLLWLLVWQAASMALDSDILLVSPLRVIATLLALLPTARFWASLLGPMARPVIYTNVLAGVRAADRELAEMARVFRIPLLRRIRCIALPQVAPYFRAGCALGLGLCWKAGVAAEVIGMPVPSIGERLQQAKVYLDTPELFAWTLVIVLISVGFEKLFMAALGALERRLTRL